MRKALFAIALLGTTLAIYGRPTPAAAPPAPPLWLIATHANDPESTLTRVDAAHATLEPLARLPHLPGATVRGAAMPDGRTVMVVADRALFRVQAGAAPAQLCDRVDVASRPLVTSEGRVLVSRSRGNEVSVDEIDPNSGAARPVWQGSGFLAHLAGAWNGEIVIYRVHAGGAALLAVTLDGGRVRSLIPSLPPFARDFSIAGDRLVFAGRDEEDSNQWVVDALELRTGARERLYRSSSQHLAPHVWPGGLVAIAEDQRGLTLLGAGVHAAAGAGVDVVRALSADGRFAAAWHYPPGAAEPEVLVLDAQARLQARYARPQTRLEIVGFAGSGAP